MEKEKTTGRIAILIVFAVTICFSKVIWFFAEKYVDSENYENREMAEMPRLTLDGYGDFSKEYDSYFNDNLQFRNSLVSLNSEIDYFVFGESSNEQVIVGDDNWLFYTNEEDGDPVGCYQGKGLYTEEELEGIAQNCLTQRDLLSSQGKEFVIFIAPNKERVYSEYMPEKYGRPAEQYGALQIYEYLKENTDLRVVYPYAELMEAKEKLDENIWYKTDTHWNYVGGYVGASALMKELGIDMPPVYGRDISIIDAGEKAGDLANMLNLSKQLEFADREYLVDGFDWHNAICLESSFEGMMSYAAVYADPRSIYVIRDSFSSNMAGYIGSQFTYSHLRNRSSYSYGDLLACDSDIVVYETVERYVGQLGTFSIQ